MALDEKYPHALPEGTILAGQYVIEKALGQGGFGITYKAADHKTGQSVAVKEFFPDSMAQRATQTTVTAFSGERGESFAYGKGCFLQEAETLAQFIGNEHIVRVFSYFEENGTAYFVMEFVEGTSFDQYIKERGGKLPYEEAERILLPVIDALAAVHAKGIVHRDVTPDNIYITKDGTVKLLDFGAARYSLGDKSRSLDVVLKHGFAPKEQYTRHGKQGPFTDVYTVGASFYFAITGKRPPDSIDRMEEDEMIPPSSLVRIPFEKEDAILKAMSVQPSNRYQTMVDFRQALMSPPEEGTQNVEAQAAEAMPLQGAAAAQGVQPRPVQQRVFTAPQPEPRVQPFQGSIPQQGDLPQPTSREGENPEGGKGTKIVAVLGILGSIVFQTLYGKYSLFGFLFSIVLMTAGVYAVYRLVGKQGEICKKDRIVRIVLCESWVVATCGYNYYIIYITDNSLWLSVSLTAFALIATVISLIIIMADKKKNGKMPQGDKNRAIVKINEVTAMLISLEGLLYFYYYGYVALNVLHGLHYNFSMDVILYDICSLLFCFLTLVSIYIVFACMEKQVCMEKNENRQYRIARIVLCESVVVFLGRWCFLENVGESVTMKIAFLGRGWYLDRVWWFDVAEFLVIALIAAVSLFILKANKKKDGEMLRESEKETSLVRRTAILVAAEGILMILVNLKNLGDLSGWGYGIFLILLGFSVAHVYGKKCDDKHKKGNKRYRSARLVLCESVPFAFLGTAGLSIGVSRGYYTIQYSVSLMLPMIMAAVTSLIVMMTSRNKQDLNENEANVR